MSIAEIIADYFESTSQEVFIEAEGKPSHIRKFIDDYNRKYGENLQMMDEGLIVLQEDANKWWLELRIYFNDKAGMPDDVKVTKNTVYRPEYRYRINNNDIIRELFDYGYRIGFN